MRKLVVGILAHVDAGKTTLSESLIYLSGKTRRLGRVDSQDAYLDTHDLEKQRGITIFSKQAVLQVGETQIILVDTPGHVDFSTEMERTLRILDCAVLVVSGADGVQGHTRTVWDLLERYGIPTFLFINKMDQVGTEAAALMADLQQQLHLGCSDFSAGESENLYEQLALCDDAMLKSFLDGEGISLEQIQAAIGDRRVFPCFFGSALKLHGVEQFMQGLVHYARVPSYSDQFGAKIFKISRDSQGTRLVHMKLTGGKLKVKDVVGNGIWEDKINQLRIYSGEKCEVVQEVEAGSVCAVTGLGQARADDILGVEKHGPQVVLSPVLSYQIILPEGCDPKGLLPKLREIEEEEPALQIIWDEALQEIQVQIMGEVQTEILQHLIESRFGRKVSFGAGRILYKETIANVVEGVGHFEPLGHYAEVHLLLEPGERGSGLQYSVDCSEDELGKNWQRLILSHLQEKSHKGVLTGSDITDIKITLVSGRAHNTHTDGGDFREATYRAVRQGLQQAKCLLLEPNYAFRLELPEAMIGRAMTDIERMQGTCEISGQDGERTLLTGTAPVATMGNYHREVAAYTRGTGTLACVLQGYEVCHNAAEMIATIGYDPERDAENPTGSVFCAHGSGFFVPWDKVKNYMHLESSLKRQQDSSGSPSPPNIFGVMDSKDFNDQFFHRISHANQGKRKGWNRRETTVHSELVTSPKIRSGAKAEYLLVDGYNIIHAWPDLKEIAREDMDAARVKLLDGLSSLQVIGTPKIIVVFDAYRVQRLHADVTEYHDLHVVYTKQAQTADQYIEGFAFEHQGEYEITVATSDGLQQVIIRCAGCALWSATDLWAAVENARKSIRYYQENPNQWERAVREGLPPGTEEKMKAKLKPTPRSNSKD